jgi:hypothetical protein
MEGREERKVYSSGGCGLICQGTRTEGIWFHPSATAATLRPSMAPIPTQSLPQFVSDLQQHKQVADCGFLRLENSCYLPLQTAVFLRPAGQRGSLPPVMRMLLRETCEREGGPLPRRPLPDECGETPVASRLLCRQVKRALRAEPCAAMPEAVRILLE